MKSELTFEQLQAIAGFGQMAAQIDRFDLAEKFHEKMRNLGYGRALSSAGIEDLFSVVLQVLAFERSQDEGEKSEDASPLMLRERLLILSRNERSLPFKLQSRTKQTAVFLFALMPITRQSQYAPLFTERCHSWRRRTAAMVGIAAEVLYERVAQMYGSKEEVVGEKPKQAAVG